MSTRVILPPSVTTIHGRKLKYLWHNMLKEPNYTAVPIKSKASRNLATKEGYQWFETDFKTKKLLPIKKGKLDRKRHLIEPIISRRVAGKTVLDLGCDKGYFSWYAMQCGAIEVVANDVNQPSQEYLMFLKKTMKWDRLHPSNVDLIVNPGPSFDIVLALAVVHEIMIHRKLSVEQTIEKIKQMATEGAIVEFCEDYQYKFGPDWCKTRFEDLLSRWFTLSTLIGSYEAIAEMKGVRYIYDCYC